VRRSAAAVELLDGFIDAGPMIEEHCKRLLEGHQFAFGLGRIFPSQTQSFDLGDLFGDGALGFCDVGIRFAYTQADPSSSAPQDPEIRYLKPRPAYYALG
jgi:hypothetical protein